MSDGIRKLRLGVMGEFSAGKSTLCNLLLGARPLTERVTATRLSPVWITAGAPALERELLDGSREALALDDLQSVPIDGTRSIRLYAQSDALDMFDLIDFPGISDPNMPTEVWERLVPELDAVLWCTHANQAWRQSEAEVWRSIPGDVQARSLLLITRFDTIISERDRGRVLARVRHETKGHFAGIFPISLTQALAGGDDPQAWDASGAEPFTAHLIELIAKLQIELENGTLPDRAPKLEARPAQDEVGDYALAPDDGFAEMVFSDNEPAPYSAPPVAAQPVRQTYAEPAPQPEAPSLRVRHEPELTPDMPPEEPQRPLRRKPAPERASPVGEAPSPAPSADEMPMEDAMSEAPKTKPTISLLAKRINKPDAAMDSPSVVPRRVQPSGARRTERPSGDGASVGAMRMDALKEEMSKATASPDALRDVLDRG